MNAPYKSHETILYSHKLIPVFAHDCSTDPQRGKGFSQLCSCVLFPVKCGDQIYSQVLHYGAIFNFFSLKPHDSRKCDVLFPSEDHGKRFIMMNL